MLFYCFLSFSRMVYRSFLFLIWYNIIWEPVRKQASLLSLYFMMKWFSHKWPDGLKHMVIFSYVITINMLCSPGVNSACLLLNCLHNTCPSLAICLVFFTIITQNCCCCWLHILGVLHGAFSHSHLSTIAHLTPCKTPQDLQKNSLSFFSKPTPPFSHSLSVFVGLACDGGTGVFSSSPSLLLTDADQAGACPH